MIDIHQLRDVSKAYVAGTHRTRSPRETLREYSPLMRRMGITRIAGVTGLDHIGIPVYTAIRPNARSISVFQGKGLDPDSAKASALMEAIECWHAEHIDSPLRWESCRVMASSARILDIDGPGPLAVRSPPRDVPMPWIEGFDLIREQPTWVPHELVSLDGVKAAGREPLFVGGSNGLASGNHMLEALAHALCEVIERDASSLWFLGSEDPSGKSTQVDFATVDDAVCQSILDTIAAAGLLVAAYDVTSDIGVPVYQCVLLDPPGGVRKMGYFWGFGCHLSPAVALARALTEAVQCRLTEISGSRDDVRHDDYVSNRDDDELREMAEMIAYPPPPVRFDARPSLATDTFQGDVDVLLESLRRAELESAVAIDLSRSDIGIPVVKVIVPELEGCFKEAGYVPGERAKRRMTAEAS